jgi:hypothetical protein
VLRATKRIYLSYSAIDASAVTEWLNSVLSMRGYEVFWDKEGLRETTGITLDWRLEEAIRANDVVLALMSPDSVRPDGECRSEISVSLALSKPIVPIMVNQCERPLRLFDLPFVDLKAFSNLGESQRTASLDKIVRFIESAIHRESAHPSSNQRFQPDSSSYDSPTREITSAGTRHSIRFPDPMNPTNLTVFVSYRREDSQDVVGRIYDRLVAMMPPERIIRDIDSLVIGQPFPEALNEAVSKSDIVLVIIGKHWLTASDSDGARRLDDTGDFVRMEIEQALAAGKHVVPVLVSNAAMPMSKDLPESIRSLVNQHGIQVRPDPDFHGDMERLIRQLGRVR